MNTVLITGASGFIGSAVADRLRVNNSVISLSRDDGDVADRNTFSSLPAATHVIHLASRHFVPDSWSHPAEFMKTNLLGTQNVIDYCIKHSSKLIFSSAYLYGLPDSLPVSEGHTLRPNNPYALSKSISEELIRFFSMYANLQATIFRFFNVYGANQSKEYLVPSIFNQIIAGEDVVVNDFLPSRDYVYIEDVVDAIELALEADYGLEVFNIGSGVSHSVKELAELAVRISGSHVKIRSRKSRRENEIMNVVSDCSKANLQLGWSAKHTLESGLRKIWSLQGSAQ